MATGGLNKGWLVEQLQIDSENIDHQQWVGGWCLITCKWLQCRIKKRKQKSAGQNASMTKKHTGANTCATKPNTDQLPHTDQDKKRAHRKMQGSKTECLDPSTLACQAVKTIRKTARGGWRKLQSQQARMPA